MEKIFRKFLVAYKPEQVREIFQEIGADKMRFEPVGGRPNNISTINSRSFGMTFQKGKAFPHIGWRSRENQFKIENPEFKIDRTGRYRSRY